MSAATQERTDPQAGAGEPDPRRWKALSICLIAGFMTLLDVSIVNVALDSIRTGVHATESDLQWVVSGYALTFGLVLVPAGRLGDARGRRPVFIFGLALFTAASAACGLAPTAFTLIVARLVQGIGGGFLTPQISGIIQNSFRGKERGKAFGRFGLTVGLSTAVGPVVGGLLIKAFGVGEGWRWIFFVNLPVGIVAMVLAHKVIAHQARTKAERGKQDLDPVGVVLLGAAVIMLLLPFVEEQQWHGSAKWLLLVPAALSLVSYLLWERRYGRQGKQPVVDLELFRIRSYSLGASLGLLYFAGFTGIFFTYTLFLQSGLHYTALVAGLAVTPFALGTAIAAPLGGRRVTEVGRPLVAVGLAMVVAGLVGTWIAVQQVPGHDIGWVTVAPLLFAGLGSGLVITPNITLTLAEAPVARAGSAGGVLQTGQRIGSAAGIAAIGSVFFSHVASSRGDYAVAFRDALVVITIFIVLALAVALLDVVTGRGARAAGRAERSGSAVAGAHHAQVT